jgi:hypothetical protein
MTINLSHHRPDAESLSAFENDLNNIREETMSKVGQADARYIRNHSHSTQW